MKRFIIAIATVVVSLAAAGSAFAAVNNYTASYKFSGAKATKAKPGKLSFKQTITVTPGTSGQRTGVLHQITTKIDNVRSTPRASRPAPRRRSTAPRTTPGATPRRRSPRATSTPS